MIKVPLALKSVGIGIQTSAGTIWTVLVTAEMLSGKGGLGYKTWESYTLLNYPKVLAGMILIGVSGYILNFGVNKLFKHFFGGYYVD
jgi:NitT/TauT family transport system permease protein